MALLLTVCAFADNGSPWHGSWVLDATQSDELGPVVQRAIRAPLLTGGNARQRSAVQGSL